MEAIAAVAPEAAPADVCGRPTQALPFTHLLRISAYWLGLTAIDGCISIVLQNRLQYDHLVAQDMVGRSLFLVSIGGAIVAIVTQPTVGYLSDFTVSRWGRRKPYVLVGSLLDLVFLFGIASSHTLLALAAFVMLLQFSTNVARGPFQGYVPDLVAESQVGLASALVGLMQISGNVVGYAAASIAAASGNLPLALVAVAVIELVTMLSVVWRVGHGLPPRDRAGRSWPQVAREAWATDILAERSYVWLLASRLFFLVGGGMLFNFVIVYLAQVFGLSQAGANEVNIVMLVVVTASTLVAIAPAARLSDRIGRKPVIYAACAIGGAGTILAALAPAIPVAVVGAGLYAAAAGMFLSVDWALMTDIIPRVSAGRYMGLSNVATGSSGPIALAIGGTIIDAVNALAGGGVGPRVAFLTGAACYVVAAVLLRRVVEPPRSVLRPAVIAAAPGTGVSA